MITQAIVTKYHGATDTRGARVSATAERGRISIPFPYECGITEAHECARAALVAKFTAEDLKRNGTPEALNPWAGRWVVGGLPRRGYVFVRVLEAAQ